MRSYITNKKQYIIFNSCQSDYSELYTGVPHGSILSHLFFSIFINDIINVSKRLKIVLYADDTTIYFNLEEFGYLNKERDINSDLEKVNTWLKLNKLSLKAQKTKLMVFHRKQKHVDGINIQINGTQIERVESVNFLGIMLDENLTGKATLRW